jgi:hypothetical protein
MVRYGLLPKYQEIPHIQGLLHTLRYDGSVRRTVCRMLSSVAGLQPPHNMMRHL